MRPGRLELPGPNGPQGPQPLRATCPIRPKAVGTHISSARPDDLDLVDEAIRCHGVVTQEGGTALPPARSERALARKARSLQARGYYRPEPLLPSSGPPSYRASGVLARVVESDAVVPEPC